MATIYDVAKRAGVSPKTVSRVLNEDAPVSATTRAAVVEAMAALQYVPSVAARSIRSQRSGLVGLVTGAITTAPEAPQDTGLPDLLIVQGVQNAIAQSGKTLLISDTGGRQDRVPALVRTFREHRVEGLLYVADHHQKVDLPLSLDRPRTVLVNCYDERNTPAVIPDDEAGQHALTQAVIAAGHRRIAYLTLPRALTATPLREAGYRRALAEAGIPYDGDLVAPGHEPGGAEEHDTSWEALDRFLRHRDPPTAICCGNDRMAMAVYGILRDRGLVVPEEMSVAGFDDHRMISESLYPALTTAELPYAAMGQRAARLLLELIENPAATLPAEPIRVAGGVRMRGSVIAARQGPGAVIELKGRKRR